MEKLEGFRLSPQQRHLWACEQQSPSGAACFTVGITGRIDPRRLREAARSFALRHEILRTHYRSSPGIKAPIQVISQGAKIRWREADLRRADSAARDAAARDLWSAETGSPFDLAGGALTRAALARLEDERWMLQLSFPVLATDGPSMRNLFTDLVWGYRAPRGDDDLIQFVQFSEWHNDYLESEASEAGRSFWRRRRQPAAEGPLLPFETPVEAVAERARERWTFELPSGVAGQLAALADRHGGTVEGFLLACWQALLGRIAGYGEWETGFLGAHRKHAELADAVGPLVIAVPIPSHPHGDLPFLRAWNRTDREIAEASQWQECYPVDGDGSVSPIGFELLDRPGSEQVGDVTFSFLGFDSPAEPFHLKLSCLLGDDPLQGALSYVPERHARDLIELLGERFQTVVKSALARPESALDELEILGESERLWMLEDLNRTYRRFPPVTVDRWLTDSLARAPDRAAVVAGDAHLTRGELLARARRLAGTLGELGVGPDDLVAVCLPRSPELMVAVLGVLAAGGAFLPLDPGQPRKRLEHMLAESGARLLVTGASLAELLPEPSMPRLLLDREPEEIVVRPERGPGAATDLANLAYVIYTSGSTGQPKGTMVTHGGLANYLRWCVEYYRADQGSGAPLHSPIGFDLTITSLLVPLLAGTSVHLVPEEEGVEGLAADLLAQSGYSFVKLTPSHLEILDELLAPEQVAGRTSVLVIGGEALRYPVLASWREHAPATRLINEYGPTETVVGCCVHEVTPDEPTAGAVPIGRPIANTALYLLDERLRAVPRGSVGEIFISGDGVARGYLGRPELTAERFVPNPFGCGGRSYRTGDLGRFLPRGGVEFLGRTDDQVKIRGFRIEPGEIEGVLSEHPGVREAVVLTKDSGAGAQLVAYVLPDPERRPTVVELRAHLLAILPEPMVPAAFVQLTSLPLTRNGKIDRKALPEIEEESAGGLARRHPRSQIEALVADLWAQLLGREQVSLEDDFFELGGHSLSAMQLIARVRSLLEVDLSIDDFLEEPTLAGLAGRVERTLQEGPSAPRPTLEPVDRSAPLVLSFAQERLWLIDQMQPGNVAYNVPAAFSYQGPLYLVALARSLAGIVRRHEVLRTTFERRPDGPVQVVQPFSAPSLPVLDLTGLPREKRRIEAERLAEREFRRAFDLARGPLLRAVVVRLAEQEHRLLLTLHHIVCDAWSMEVLAGEWAALYEAFSGDGRSPLPELPIQYADFAAWQRSWLQGEALARQLAFWRARLEHHPPPLELPTSRPRAAVQTFRGAKRSRGLSASLAERVAAFARQERATMFMVLLAVYEVLLHRYTGQETFLVGTPVARREDPRLERLIGFFLNTLVLRAELAGTADARQVVAAVRRDTLNAFAHSDLPFEKLVEEVAAERDWSRPPLFQVVFSMQRPPAMPGFGAPSGDSAEDVRAQVLATGTGTSKADLNLEVTGGPEALAATLEYNTDLFDGTFAVRLLGHFEALLESALRQPALPIVHLPFLREAEQRQLLSEWSVGSAAPLPATSLHRLFERWAAEAPDRIAVVFEDRWLTYGELDRRAERLMRRLRGHGVAPESLIGLCLERSAEMIVAILAVFKAGAAYVPLDPSYPRERLAFILDDAKVSVLLTQEGADDHLPTRQPLAIDVSADAGAESPASPPGAEPCSPVGPGNLAYTIYTSGSTGRPKGVLCPHLGLASLAVTQAAAFDVRPESRVLQFASLSFDASVSELGMTFAMGATLVLADRASLMPGPDLIDLFARESITHVTLPPSALAVLPESGPVPAAVIVAGEACPPDLVERWAPGRRFFNAYGPTEVTVCATWTEVEVDGSRPPIGRPLANTRVHALDPRLALQPAGVPGEVCVGGLGVTRGYLGRPGATAERFVPNPYDASPGARLYRTGDLARFLPDGRLDFIGRRDDLVKVRGFRVEPGEVEAALARHPGVSRCAVVAREDGAGGQRLIGYLEPRAPSAPEAEELRAFLQDILPAPLVPSQFMVVPALPLLPNGKVDRRNLPDPDRARPGPRDASMVPGTQVEELLAGIWSEVLKAPQCGADDGFFDLGGSSLAATQVLSRVRDVFGVEIPLSRLFEGTLKDLSREIEGALRTGAGAAPAITPGPEEGAAPLSFPQELMWRAAQAPGGDRADIVPAAVRLVGEIDAAALGEALGEVVRRHATLRTSFPVVDGRPVQRIGPVPPMTLPVADLTLLPAAGRDAALDCVAGTELRQPFDLASGPVLRSLLARLAEHEHVLFLFCHHIAADQWSAGVFLRELSALYRALRAGERPTLPELSIRYTDFARWQREWFRGEVLESELLYWSEQLSGARPVELQHDGGGTQEPGSDSELVLVPAELADSLRALGRRHGATLPMVLLAAFDLLLAEHTSQRDLLVAVPVANRSRQELEPLIGFFANTLVVRTDLAGNPSFTRLLTTVREAALGAYMHQDLPIDVLAENVGGELGLARADFLRVAFNMQNAPVPALDLPGVRIEPYPVKGPDMRSDLLLGVTEGAEGILCRFQYRRSQVSKRSAQALAQRFHLLLKRVVEDPGKRISELILPRT